MSQGRPYPRFPYTIFLTRFARPLVVTLPLFSPSAAVRGRDPLLAPFGET